MAHRAPGLHQLPPALAVRPHRRPRPRRRPMAHPLPQTILQCRTTRLARPVGAQRLAELCDYRLASAGNVLDRVEIWQFAGGTGVAIRQ